MIVPGSSGRRVVNLRGYNANSASIARKESPNPMDNIANLVDVMLVLACGLMLALLSYWKLDLPQITELTQEEEITNINALDQINESLESSGTTYSELGTVYEDTETGKTYMVVEGDSSQ